MNNKNKEDSLLIFLSCMSILAIIMFFVFGEVAHFAIRNTLRAFCFLVIVITAFPVVGVLSERSRDR